MEAQALGRFLQVVPASCLADNLADDIMLVLVLDEIVQSQHVPIFRSLDRLTGQQAERPVRAPLYIRRAETVSMVVRHARHD